MKYTKKNSDILPFEAGGEVKLEQYASKADCGQFVIGNHTKKRPDNLILGRLYDNRLYDLLEVGVENYRSIKSFGVASSIVQTQNKVPPEAEGNQRRCSTLKSLADRLCPKAILNAALFSKGLYEGSHGQQK